MSPFSSIPPASFRYASQPADKSQGVYHELAEIYDEIMHGVDYEDWTDYIDSIIQFHHPKAQHILELACGTGTMALELEQFADYHIVATDKSPDMIRLARSKAESAGSTIEWEVQDMCRLEVNKRFDIIFMVFDSFNYLHNESDVQSLFQAVKNHLDPAGRFIFDFATPNFSLKIAPELNENRNIRGVFSYNRESHYDSEKKIHVNHFRVQKHSPLTNKEIHRFEEVHQQRIWTYKEICDMVSRSCLTFEAAYEDFDFSDATSNSDRITMVLRQ